MKQLISVITKQILKQIRQNEINMVRLESFDRNIDSLRRRATRIGLKR